jgi:hypothetical protein
LSRFPQAVFVPLHLLADPRHCWKDISSANGLIDGLHALWIRYHKNAQLLFVTGNDAVSSKSILLIHRAPVKMWLNQAA